MSLSQGDRSQVAIIDDQPANLRLLMNVLESHNYDVRAFPKGTLALEGMKYALPDLILLDIQMPEMNGYQVCEHLKSNPETQDIPVLFISALDEAFDKVQAFEKGGVDYITKPFQAEEVLARVATHLNLSRLTRQLSNTNVAQAEQLATQNQQLQNTVQLLESSIQEVQQTQTQLVQQEKMAALGGLVAGIAHEINNPLNFIIGNLQPAQDYVQDLLNLIDLYQQTFPTPGEEIEAESDSMDLGFIRQDLPKLLQSMKIGAERIRNISRSLRIFGRGDSDTATQFDLHEVIESTILILKHRLKPSDHRSEIKIQTQYDSQLPEIEGFPGEFSQVVMNILANAIDAIDEKCESPGLLTEQAYRPQIRVITSLVAQKIATIKIQDNAGGMPPEVESRIFESGFTTKGMGKGTGLGMAIAQQLITEKHNGLLTCHSVIGEGTTFTIEIGLP
ncbi:MAG: hybrid sensor histidine kinase/response regulator [Spirulina sp. SIO3F2]|nr:hybrid sensor histidine kinase/response regulator [Spirulina sp. SIO3F2]